MDPAENTENKLFRPLVDICLIVWYKRLYRLFDTANLIIV